MIRTIFAVGAMAIVGVLAMKLMFGIFGLFVGLFGLLLWWAIKIAIIGLIVYVIIRIISPNTAQKIKDNVSGA